MLNKRERRIFPQDYTTDDVRPQTMTQALMEEGPTTPHQTSIEEVRPLLDSIEYATELLTEEQTFIINAIAFEDITFEELGDRLGVSRTHAWRLHNHAMTRLQYLMQLYKPVRERLGMEPTWQSEAMDELVHIAGDNFDDPIESDTPVVGTVYVIDFLMTGAVGQFDQGLEMNAVEGLVAAAREAVSYLRSVNQWSLVRMHELLVSKQMDYGHGNILKFGMYGVLVRASDKVERLKNLTAEGVRPRNESLLDSFRDIIGYAVIARMLKMETFELDLDRESIEWHPEQAAA